LKNITETQIIKQDCRGNLSFSLIITVWM